MTYQSERRKVPQGQILHRCPTREQQLRDIATSGSEDAAECVFSDAFKEFPGKEGI